MASTGSLSSKAFVLASLASKYSENDWALTYEGLTKYIRTTTAAALNRIWIPLSLQDGLIISIELWPRNIRYGRDVALRLKRFRFQKQNETRLIDNEHINCCGSYRLVGVAYLIGGVEACAIFALNST